MSHPESETQQMGRRPPDKRKILEAQLAGAHARLADMQSRGADQPTLDECHHRIAEIEHVLSDGATPYIRVEPGLSSLLIAILHRLGITVRAAVTAPGHSLAWAPTVTARRLS